MSIIENKVKEGFKSLGRKTLDLYREFSSNIDITPKGREFFSEFKDNLKFIRNKGDIKKIGKDGENNFRDLMYIADQEINYNLKPTDVNSSLDMAGTSVSAYYGISNDELKERMYVDSFIQTEKYPSILSTDEGGKMKRIFYVFFKDSVAAYSVLLNIHEIIHTLQEDSNKIDRIMVERDRIKGHHELMTEIKKDQNLRKKRIEIATDSHELNFLKLLEVMKKGEEVGVDIEHLSRYLEENIPTANFLSCYIDGEAFLLERDIIKAHPILKNYNNQLKSYELIAAVDALVAPFAEERGKVYEVGIGLYEWFRNNPDMISLKDSREFHLELTNAYFK